MTWFIYDFRIFVETCHCNISKLYLSCKMSWIGLGAGKSFVVITYWLILFNRLQDLCILLNFNFQKKSCVVLTTVQIWPYCPSGMSSRAMSSVYWPGMTADITRTRSTCFSSDKQSLRSSSSWWTGIKIGEILISLIFF